MIADCHEVLPHTPTLECASGVAVACLAVFLAAWVLCSLLLVAAVAFEDRYVDFIYPSRSIDH